MSAAELPNSQVLILIGTWLFYFLIHSILASLAAKRLVANHWPGLMPAYRLLFNLIALALLLPPLFLTYHLEGPWLWRWSGPAWWLANGSAIVALALFYWTLKYYDSSEFIGIKQWRERVDSVEDQEHFHLSPMHRFVRHPWYFLALVLIWSRDMNLPFLLTAIVITLYFWVGSRMEESKLVAYHGSVYKRYREKVPGLLPLPWRYLSREAAEEFERNANRG